ncbi:PaaI family thioesterase [Pedobacter sp. KBW06]|uniref:PaaI family thioesterase n=1 Tax=Pedobacter sp. KBW06 TaxID=2153359 RepID=UPI000F5AF418|nr:PaaI family thioesterase [Pedobacter sp. KBW06]RQO73846.1 PaaI family thioesterase [Pedobacter sp. KBW06]
MLTPSEFFTQNIGNEMTTSPSPLFNWLKPVILLVEKGKLILKYTIRNEMTNPMGILHGGMTAAIIDDAIGATLFGYDEPYYYVTVNLAIDYFASAKEGDLIIAETTMIKKGNQIANVQCEVWNEGRTRIIARGYSNLLRTEKRK